MQAEMADDESTSLVCIMFLCNFVSERISFNGCYIINGIDYLVTFLMCLTASRLYQLSFMASATNWRSDRGSSGWFSSTTASNWGYTECRRGGYSLGIRLFTIFIMCLNIQILSYLAKYFYKFKSVVPCLIIYQCHYFFLCAFFKHFAFVIFPCFQVATSIQEKLIASRTALPRMIRTREDEMKSEVSLLTKRQGSNNTSHASLTDLKASFGNMCYIFFHVGFISTDPLFVKQQHQFTKNLSLLEQQVWVFVSGGIMYFELTLFYMFCSSFRRRWWHIWWVL